MYQPSGPTAVGAGAKAVDQIHVGNGGTVQVGDTHIHSGKPRKVSWPVRVGLIALVVLLAVSGIIAVNQFADSSSVAPTDAASPDNTAPVQADGLSASASDDTYRLVLNLKNNLPQEQSLQTLRLIVTGAGAPCAEGAPVVLFEVHDVAIAMADPSSKIVQGSVSAETGPASGFQVPTQGVYNTGCAHNQLQLSFAPPATLLERAEITQVVVDVPRMIGVAYRLMPAPGADALTERTPAEADRIPLPDVQGFAGKYDQWVAFRVTAVTTGGNTIDSCFLLALSESSGPRDCDYKVDGYPAFWREIFVSEGQLRLER